MMTIEDDGGSIAEGFTAYRSLRSPELDRVCGRLIASYGRLEGVKILAPRGQDHQQLRIRMVNSEHVKKNAAALGDLSRQAVYEVLENAPEFQASPALQVTDARFESGKRRGASDLILLDLSEGSKAELSNERQLIGEKLAELRGIPFKDFLWPTISPYVRLAYLPLELSADIANPILDIIREGGPEFELKLRPGLTLLPKLHNCD